MDIQDLLNLGQQPTTPTTTPATPHIPQRSSELTRDEKIEIRTLHTYARWSYPRIAQALGKTQRQVQLACTTPLTPRKSRCGRKALLDTPLKQKLQLWMLEEEIHRQIPWCDLRFFLPPDLSIYGETALTTALRSLGYRRAIRPRRIKRTEANKRARVAFAREQLALRPNPEDWEHVVFSDETWATNDPMWKKWITIHETEDPETWALLRRKPHGWMFWGQFAGQKKGSGYIWEKEFGGITAHKYIFMVLPLVYRFFLDYPTLQIFQQDNAPSHRAKITKEALRQMGIYFLKWPANSPDLNPIENVWHWMKSWIERNYDIQSLEIQDLRAAVEAAWDAVPEDFLLTLAHSMVKRLQLVIEKNGESIGY